MSPSISMVPSTSAMPSPSCNAIFCSCPIGQEIINVQIVTDLYPDETSWTLTDTCGGINEVVLTGGPYSLPNKVYSANYCAYPGIEYQFTIYVSYFSLGDVFVR